jgi:nucleoside-diphosphate-sugar epimerase
MSHLEHLADRTALVTGATGFSGAVLVRRLVEAGARVRAIARPSSSLDALRDLPIDWVRGEVFDEPTLARASSGVHFVFHLAAAYRTASRDDDYYRQVHVVSTERLVRQARAQPDFQRFVHVSTIGVHGHIEHPPADETTPFSPGDIYQRTKAEAETWLREHAPTLGVPFTIVRPSAIYGPGDTRLLKLFRFASYGVFPMLGRRDTLYHLVHVEDLARILCLAAVHPDAAGEAFIAGDPAPLTMSRIMTIIGDALGRRVRIVRFPAGPVFLLADVCERACRPLGLEPPLHRRRVAFYTKDRAFDTRKLRDRLGYECRVRPEDGLAETARWYVAQGWIRGGAQ